MTPAPSAPKKAAAKPKTTKKTEETAAPKKAAAPSKTAKAVKASDPTPLFPETPKKAPAAKKAAPKADSPKAAPKADSPKTDSPVRVVVSPEERHSMICNAAYYIAERRGFNGGDPFHDWIEAEREVDQVLGISK